MKGFLRFFPLLLLILTVLFLLLGAIKGAPFIHSRGSVLCLSCMGLEENEDF